MSEKIKVPKWFDGWCKSFNNRRWGGENDAKIYHIARMGFGSLLNDGNGNEMPMECFDYADKNREKLIRAILDGYEIEQEYIEITPVEAYGFYFHNSFEVYCKRKDDLRHHRVSTGDFIPADIRDFNKKFYIKKEG